MRLRYRLRFEHAHPVASRWIAASAIVILVAGVGVNAPQLVPVISEIPPIAERFGIFVSPIQLPLWLNITLGAGAALASMERGLRLRYKLGPRRPRELIGTGFVTAHGRNAPSVRTQNPPATVAIRLSKSTRDQSTDGGAALHGRQRIRVSRDRLRSQHPRSQNAKYPHGGEIAAVLL